MAQERVADVVSILYRQQAAAAVAPIAGGPNLSARLTVYDVRGRLVRVLLDGSSAAGSNEIIWRGRDDRGRQLPSGTYIMQLETAQGLASTRVGLIR